MDYQLLCIIHSETIIAKNFYIKQLFFVAAGLSMRNCSLLKYWKNNIVVSGYTRNGDKDNEKKLSPYLLRLGRREKFNLFGNE